MQKWDYVFILKNIETGDLYKVYQSALDASSFDKDSDAVLFFRILTEPFVSSMYKYYESEIQSQFNRELAEDREFYSQLSEKDLREINRNVSHSNLIAMLGVRGWEYIEYHKIGSKYRLYTFRKNRSEDVELNLEIGKHHKSYEYLIFFRSKSTRYIYPLITTPLQGELLIDYDKYIADRASEIEKRVNDYKIHLKSSLPTNEFNNVERQLTHIFMVAILGGDGWEFVQQLKVGPNTRFKIFRREIIRVQQA